MQARQGHAYQHNGQKVIALENGVDIRVAPVHDGWLGRPYRVGASDLEPLPMVYFHGQLPT